VSETAHGPKRESVAAEFHRFVRLLERLPHSGPVPLRACHSMVGLLSCVWRQPVKLSFITAIAALTTTGLVLAAAASGSTLMRHRASQGLTASAMAPEQVNAYDACLRDHEVVDMSWSATEEYCRQQVESGPQH
jgi:hypothetical protein